MVTVFDEKLEGYRNTLIKRHINITAEALN